jgi:OOP family OmpA-OmpF porin
MTKRFSPPAARRLGVVAIAAALAAFAGVASAQPSSKPVGVPGYVSNASGDLVKNGFGGCVVTGQAPAPGGGACPPGAASAASGASAAPMGSAAAPAGRAATQRSAAAGGSAAAGSGAPAGIPGYAVASNGRVVQSGFGQCVRAGHWTPANAAEPCDRIARADVAAPVQVAQPAPEPKLEPAPAPAPMAQAATAPAPVAQPEPPRPVIQKLTLSTDVLFDFNQAELKDSGKARLDQLAAELKDASVDEIIATGHADRIASEEYNQKLSEARAQAVKDYLGGKVANANRVTAEGKGESQPVTGDDCKKLGAERSSNKKLVTCLQPDRRVEIEVLGTREVAAGTPPAAGTGATGAPASGASGGGSTGSSTTR